MASKRARRKAKKRNAQRAAEVGLTAPKRATDARVATIPRQTTAPTPERLKRGTWHKGSKIAHQDIASDMIGRLSVERKLTAQQVEAARTFQELRAAYEAEIGASGYGSCLDISSGGYDSGDGNAAVLREYRAVQERIGRVNVACLCIETAKGPDARPHDLAVLRNALDVMGA